MKKLAIIGASSFQSPLILKAKARGIETHVFAWASGDVGEGQADHFYPISITEKDEILAQCERIGIDGIASIGSDLANITVAYVAARMGLVANSVDCVYKSTNKHAMRACFFEHGNPSPKSVVVTSANDVLAHNLRFPLIIKPSDRSGSRGITCLNKGVSSVEIDKAIQNAIKVSFSKIVLAEEFFEGTEYSVEYISWKGEHRFLQVTEKFTTDAPHFIETAHLEPARISPALEVKIKQVVEEALCALGVEYGASHAELKVNDNEEIALIEIGSRMGGDCIGSDLVELSSGYDFVNAVIDVALGIEPPKPHNYQRRYAAIRFAFSEDDARILQSLKNDSTCTLEFVSSFDDFNHDIVDSSTRYGYFIFTSDFLACVERYLPESKQSLAFDA